MNTSLQLILTLGFTYAAVPAYRAFCSATGFSGVPITDSNRFLPDRLYPSEESAKAERITVHFEATASDELKWKFTPQQKFVKVLPGETALAFYTAENWGTEDVIGIATYNTTPSRVRFGPVFLHCKESDTPFPSLSDGTLLCQSGMLLLRAAKDQGGRDRRSSCILLH